MSTLSSSSLLRRSRSRRRRPSGEEVVQRPLHAPLGAPVRFRQFVYTTNLTQAATAQFGSGNFTLAQLPQVATFTALFDQYKVEYLEFSFRMAYLTTPITAFTTTTMPAIYTVVDLDDVVAPTTLNQLREYSSCQIHENTPTFTVRFKPGILTGIYNGTTIVAGGATSAPWLDCNQTAIPHYGVKWGCDAGTAVGQTQFQIWNIDLAVGLVFRHVM